MLRVAILTPLTLERLAIQAHLPTPNEKMIDGEVYYCSTFKGQHHEFEIIIKQTGSKNSPVAVAAERLIQNFKPHLFFLTGIAGGIKDVSIGDVVIANKIYSYESGKEQEGGSVARPEVYRCSPSLLSLAESISNHLKWHKRVKNGNPRHVFFGPIASGDKVVATTSDNTYQIIKMHYNDSIALEMEAHGVGYTLHHYAAIQWLNIRGISDLLEGKNSQDDEDNQPTVAANAAAFLFEMLYQLDAVKINLIIMDIKTITAGVIAALTPYLVKSKSVKKITKDISEASDTTLGGIWETIKPIFIEEFEEEKDTLSEEAAEEAALQHVLKKKLKKDEEVKKQLEMLLNEREAKLPTNSTVITNSKNVVAGSRISVGGDFRLGDN